MSKYFDGEILNAYEDLNKEFEYKKENTKLQQQIIELQQQLKQSQKQLAVEELEKLKERIVLNDEYDEYTGHNIINSFELLEDINARIKELKGEK